MTTDVCKQLDCIDPKLINQWVLPLLSLPHFLYAFIWFNPRVWQSLFGKHSVKVFAFCGFLGKGEREATWMA